METEGNDFSTANIHAVVKVPSVTTGNETRDTHLKSDDFFNAESFKELLFTGKSFKPVADNKWLLEGDITIRDVTKPISFDVEYMGMMDDPWGNSKAGFEVNGIVSRKEFGLKWNVLTDTGGVVAGDEVKIHCNVQFIKQK